MRCWYSYTIEPEMKLAEVQEKDVEYQSCGHFSSFTQSQLPQHRSLSYGALITFPVWMSARAHFGEFTNFFRKCSLCKTLYFRLFHFYSIKNMEFRIITMKYCKHYNETWHRRILQCFLLIPSMNVYDMYVSV